MEITSKHTERLGAARKTINLLDLAGTGATYQLD